MADTISYRFRLRRRLASAWASLNEILLDSEIGLVSDTREMKVGDGSTAWSSLPYIEGGMNLSRHGDVNAAGRADGLALVWDEVAGKHVYGVGGGTGGYFGDPASVHERFDDLDTEISAITYSTDWTIQASGTGAAVSRVGVAGRPGVFRCSTGTTTTGFGRALRGGSVTVNTPIYVPTTTEIEWQGEFRVSSLPTNADQWAAIHGLRDAFNTTSLAAVGIQWDAGAAAAKFALLTRPSSGGSGTTQLGAATPAANTWYRCKMTVTSTQVQFYLWISGAWSLQATSTTNLPDSGLTTFIQAVKTSGTNSRDADFDWNRVRMIFSSGRPA